MPRCHSESVGQKDDEEKSRLITPVFEVKQNKKEVRERQGETKERGLGKGSLGEKVICVIWWFDYMKGNLF